MGSVVIIVVNAIVVYVAFFLFGGPTALFLLFAFHLAIPIALAISAAVHFVVFVFLASNAPRSILTLLNLLTFCAVLSFIAGFFPYAPPSLMPANPLLEDYASSQVFYASLVYVMCVVEWGYIKARMRAPA